MQQTNLLTVLPGAQQEEEEEKNTDHERLAPINKNISILVSTQRAKFSE